MKRDMELVGKLLLGIESMPPGEQGFQPVEGYEYGLMVDHLFIMADAGLIDADDSSSSSGRDILVHRMTWTGHEFLDSIRKGDVWQQLATKWKHAPYEVVLELTKSLAKKKLGLGD